MPPAIKNITDMFSILKGLANFFYCYFIMIKADNADLCVGIKKLALRLYFVAPVVEKCRTLWP